MERVRPVGGDAGSIVLGWLTKLVVTLAVIGTVLFDAASITVAHVNATDDASNAASAASAEWHASHDLQQAFNAATEAVTNPDETVLTAGFSADPDGTVHLQLSRHATTLFAYRIGPLRHLTTVTVRADANTTAP